MPSHPRRRLRAPIRAALYTASLTLVFALGASLFPFALSSGQPRSHILAAAATHLSAEQTGLSDPDQTLALALPSSDLVKSDSSDRPVLPDASASLSSPAQDSPADTDAPSSAASAGSSSAQIPDTDIPSSSEPAAKSEETPSAKEESDLPSAPNDEPAAKEDTIAEAAVVDDHGFVLRHEASVSKTVLIDPGHGGDDLGDGAKDGTMEKSVVLDFARKLKIHLEKQNPSLQVVLLRDDDTRPGTSAWNDSLARLKAQEDCQADYVISLHTHALDDDSQRGYQIILDPSDPITQSLSSKIQANLASVGFSADRGLLYTSDYPLQTISMSNAHAIELDLLTLSNAQDLALLEDDAALEKAAAAVAAALSDTVIEHPEQ